MGKIYERMNRLVLQTTEQLRHPTVHSVHVISWFTLDTRVIRGTMMDPTQLNPECVILR